MYFPEAYYSRFIIDGAVQELTPAQLISSVMSPAPKDNLEPTGEIIDESVDPNPFSPALSLEEAKSIMNGLKSNEGGISLPYSASCTVGAIATCLIDTLWRQGRFRLEDIVLTSKCRWDSDIVGNMAALYRSIEAGVQYIDSLGLTLRRCSCSSGEPGLSFSTQFSGASRITREKIYPDPCSWIIYIPFDSAEFKLGGSALAEAAKSGGAACQIGDADFFMDCFEVVREFAEDGILLSASTVGIGGIYGTLNRMVGNCGAEISIAELLHANEGTGAVEALFSEIPGAIIQISDSDFDYLDAELLLQDVPFFPLGHPSSSTGLRIDNSNKGGIQTILESLMKNIN